MLFSESHTPILAGFSSLLWPQVSIMFGVAARITVSLSARCTLNLVAIGCSNGVKVISKWIKPFPMILIGYPGL
jgi:hypothetical protein